MDQDVFAQKTLEDPIDELSSGKIIVWSIFHQK